jgi:hypothetical protein
LDEKSISREGEHQQMDVRLMEVLDRRHVSDLVGRREPGSSDAPSEAVLAK